MRKKYMFVLPIVFVAVIVCSYLFLGTLKIYSLVDKGDFEIRYIFKNGFKGYDIETQVYPDGSFIKKTSYYNLAPDKIENGKYPKDDVVKFAKYAVRHKLFEMNDSMNAVNILDGVTIFFEMRIGEKSIKAGGYEAQSVSNNFMRILKRFKKLE